MSGPQPIQVTEALAYMQVAGEVCTEQRLRFLRYIQAMDQAFLEYSSREREAIPK